MSVKVLPQVAAFLLVLTGAAFAQYPDSVLATVNLGAASGPVDVCASPDGSRAYVSVEFGNVLAVETQGYTVVGSCLIGSELGALTISPGGDSLYVCNVEDERVEIIATQGMEHLGGFEVGAEPADISLTPDGERALVSCGLYQLWVMDTSSWTVLETVPVGSSPAGICVLPDGSAACVARGDAYNATLVDLDDYSAEDLFTGGDTRGSCAMGGSLVALTLPDWNIVKLMDSATGQVLAEVSGVGESPMEVCALPSGQYVYVSANQSGQLLVIEAASGMMVDTIEVGGEPLGLSANPGGAEVYAVDNLTGRMIVVGGSAAGISPGHGDTGIVLSIAGDNPCPGVALVEIELDVGAEASLRIYDASGRELLLRPMGFLAGGAHGVAVDLPAAGVYICSVETPAGVEAIRLVSTGRRGP